MSSYRDYHHRQSRSRSPAYRHHNDSSSRRHNRHDRPRRSPSPKQYAPVLLPSNSKPLDIQSSLPTYFALFAKYLDIQKSVDVMEIDERELRSRFKRFVGRWNMGELASSWYDKDYKVQIDSDSGFPSWEDYLKFQKENKPSTRRQHSQDRDRRDNRRSKDKDDSRRDRDKGRDRHRDRDGERDRDREGRRDRDRDDRQNKETRIEKRKDDKDPETREEAESRIRNMTDEELSRALQNLDGDDGGHTPPGAASEDVDMKDGNESDDSDMIGPAIPESLAKPKAGAKPPTTQDLELQRELDQEEADLSRADLRYERKRERKLEKERLDELVPRAEVGSRERQLEKKRETAASNKAFADAKAGDMEEVGESALMGGEESFQQHKAALDRKKNERELRKEALLRARKAEREERLQVHRAKEEQTMKMLRALADKFR
ncbi:hypothetical protein TWF730_005568 [Orbilia blumenaviensis]|uniref:Uncharacterized protein n=1 Tax=Orbilia blumenaviensis TaxID=1796055 RepID=A0AAV9VIR0_9PEZI